jgi:hypothetical protein
MHNPITDHAVILLNAYSFDLDEYTAEQLVDGWAEYHKPRWVKLAVIEALYQGRYKAISVAQILAFWERRGEPLCHFNHEFECIVCDNIVCDNFVPSSLTADMEEVPDRPDSDPSLDPQANAIVPNPTELLALTEDPPDQETDSPSAQPNTTTVPGKEVPEQDNPNPLHTPLTYHPIHQFVPPTDVSEFYSKLKAVASSMKE